MAFATEQALDDLSKRLDARIDLGAQNLADQIREIRTHIENLLDPNTGLPGVADFVGKTVEGLNAKVYSDLTLVHNRVRELETKQQSQNLVKWDIRDPKMRGTSKFAGDKKEDVKVFTQWRKAAYLYLDKFMPKVSSILKELRRDKADVLGYDTIRDSIHTEGHPSTLEFEYVNESLYHFLSEHLTDTAADLVEPCGENGFEVWRILHEFYEPLTDATSGTVYAQVYALAGKKAKNASELYSLLRLLEARIKKLKDIGGKIEETAKASILYNMMDDTTARATRDSSKTGDFEWMRVKIIREGCELRERSMLSKATPMDLDAMKEKEQEAEKNPEEQINAVINPNIVCFICKEKGHPARLCPHNDGNGNDGKGKGKGQGKAGQQPSWWYGNKGQGKGGGKGKGGKFGSFYPQNNFFKGNYSKGKGRAYSVESYNGWEGDGWWNNGNSTLEPGAIRDLERLSCLTAAKKPVKEPEKEQKATKRKYVKTDEFCEHIHNSVTYQRLIKAFNDDDDEDEDEDEINCPPCGPSTSTSKEAEFPNLPKRVMLNHDGAPPSESVDKIENGGKSNSTLKCGSCWAFGMPKAVETAKTDIEASLDAPPGWVVDSPEAQWEILKATLVPGYRTAEQRREERRTAMAVEKYEEMRRKEASSTPADACSLTPNGVIGSHQVDHIGHSISELSGEIKRGGIALRADEAKLAEHPELVDSDDEEELSEIIDSSDDEEDLPLVENLPMDEYMTVLENNFRKHRPVTVDETITELVMKTGHAARSDDEGDHGGDHGGVHRREGAHLNAPFPGAHLNAPFDGVHRHQGDHRGDRGNDHRALDGDGGRDRKAPPVKSPSHATKASEERRRELLEKCRSPQRDRRNPTPRESLKSCYNDIVPVQDVEEDFLMTDGSEWVKVALKKPRKGVHLLREIRDGALSTVAAPEWVEITVTVDSGASETVAPLDMATHIPIDSSEASLRGVAYEVANGQIIANKGEKNCIVQVAGGSAKLLSFQVCDVHKPLLSVSRLCEAGNAVVFHPVWSYIENLKTGERTTIEKKDGLYELKAWIRAAKGFGRQGQTA